MRFSAPKSPTAAISPVRSTTRTTNHKSTSHLLPQYIIPKPETDSCIIIIRDSKTPQGPTGGTIDGDGQTPRLKFEFRVARLTLLNILSRQTETNKLYETLSGLLAARLNAHLNGYTTFFTPSAGYTPVHASKCYATAGKYSQRHTERPSLPSWHRLIRYVPTIRLAR